ncbi:MAG: exodeoxyribonuclease V subunit alpha [Kofleriaceae bacterium]
MTAPLHPRGTLRVRFAPIQGGELFRKLGVGARTCDLGDEGLYLAEELVSADSMWLGAGDHPEALAILVLALMIAQRQGSTRLPLGTLPKSPLRTLVGDILRIAKLEIDGARVLKTITNLTATPRFNSVIGSNGDRVPLVVDDGHLYTERARWLEVRVADRLAARVAEPTRETANVIADLVARSGARPLTDEQSRAVRTALSGSLAVVTGGPGTGKTVVAATIVRGLARMGIQHVALAAQTGKAANRLTQVIAEQLAAVTSGSLSGSSLSGSSSPADADRALAAAPPAAQTLHRLLGYRRERAGGFESGHRFAHHANNPLPVGAVIVDEASMIDLELMDALLDALPMSAPLIMIGDAHQLPAIDAGQILADLARPESPEGGAKPAAVDPVALAKLSSRVAVLEKSFRMDTSDPAGRAVYDLAQAVHAGEPDGKLLTTRTASTLSFAGAEWVDTAKAKKPHDTTLEVAQAAWHYWGGHTALLAAERVFCFVDGRIDAAHSADLEALWLLLARGRLLTVTRALPTGAVAINAHLHELALDRMSVAGRPEFVPGEPVMITANDYQRGLFNGDQGMIVRADEGLSRHHYRAVFRIGGELRPFAIEALRDRLELSWALTVHKSQGSELDGVALILPHDSLPLVTRELLYTGITRARRGCAIVGSRTVFTHGCKLAALRYSGLGSRLLARLS